MDTQALIAFLSVIETGSFSEAAHRLHLTQPAVSKRIRSLENQLNARLFDRVGREVILTEAGRALIPPAERIVQEIREARQIVGNLSESVTGRLSMAISHHIGLHRLPRTLKQFIAKQTDVELDLHFLESERAYQGVLNRDLELAFVTLPNYLDKALTMEPVWDDPLCFVVGNDHMLASKKSVRLNELCYSNALLPEPDTFTYSIVKTLFEQHKLPLRTSLPINFLETIKVMVSVGHGWSVLPQTMVDDTLKVLNVENVQLARKLGYIKHRNRTLSNAAQAFLNELDQDLKLQTIKP